MVVLVVLNAYTLWMARYAASAAVHPERGELGDQLVRRIVDVVVAFVLSSNEVRNQPQRLRVRRPSVS